MEIIEQNSVLSDECIEFFKRYDLDLVFDKAQASGIVKLADWIHYLKESNFNADVNYFKN